MIDKGVGGGIMVCIIDVLREGGSGVVLNVCWEGGGVCIIPTPHRSIIPIYIRYGFLFLGLGV